MKRWLLLLILGIMLFPVQALAAPQADSGWNESIEEILTDQLDELNTNDWEPFLRYIQLEDADFLGGETIDQVIRRLITGHFSFTWQDLLNHLLRIFFHEFNLNLMLIVKITVISVICSIFKNMNDSFDNPSVGGIGYYVCYSIVMILIIQSFLSILSVGKLSVERMSAFMKILFPVLLGLLTSMGNFTSVTVLQPAVGILVAITGSVLTNFVFPLITLSAVTSLVNQISERIQVQRLGKLLNNLCIWTLTFVFTIFIGVLTIQGVLTATFDGISIRTARFAMDTFVPVVGKMFSQSLDTIIGCALLVKNAVGAAGMIIIILLCLAPAVKIFSLMFLYKLAGALLEPITDRRIIECLNGISSVLSILLITVLGIALMFFLTITLMIATGNTAVMLR